MSRSSERARWSTAPSSEASVRSRRPPLCEAASSPLRPHTDRLEPQLEDITLWSEAVIDARCKRSALAVQPGVTQYLLTSDEAVMAAQAAGDVTVTRAPDADFRCPIT